MDCLSSFLEHSLWDVYGMSMGCLWDVYGMSMGCLWDVYGSMGIQCLGRYFA